MNKSVDGAKALQRFLDITPEPPLERLIDPLRRLSGDATADGATAATVAAVDDAIAEIEAVWDPAATGSYRTARSRTLEAIRTVAMEFDSVGEVFNWRDDLR